MRDSMSFGGKLGDCIATSFPVSVLRFSSAGDPENTRGDLFSSRFAGVDEVSGLMIPLGIDAVVHPTAGIGVKTLEGVGKKLRQSL